MPGTIEVVIGPMRSNKTAELIRRVAMREEYAHQSVILFKPKDDTKSAQGMVESRNQLSHRQMDAVEFNSGDPWEMFAFIAERERIIGKPLNCVAIDEGQFVRELFDCARALLERGYDVIAAGLDLDFRGQPFGDMLALLWLVNAYGGNVTWCIAYCECGARAFFSQRLSAAPSILCFPGGRSERICPPIMNCLRAGGRNSRDGRRLDRIVWRPSHSYGSGRQSESRILYEFRERSCKEIL
jgi:thymidine kinase